VAACGIAAVRSFPGQPQPRHYVSGFLGPCFFIIEKIEKIFDTISDYPKMS
jgi:hypothetical protein